MTSLPYRHGRDLGHGASSLQLRLLICISNGGQSGAAVQMVDEVVQHFDVL